MGKNFPFWPLNGGEDTCQNNEDLLVQLFQKQQEVFEILRKMKLERDSADWKKPCFSWASPGFFQGGKGGSLPPWAFFGQNWENFAHSKEFPLDLMKHPFYEQWIQMMNHFSSLMQQWAQSFEHVPFPFGAEVKASKDFSQSPSVPSPLEENFPKSPFGS